MPWSRRRLSAPPVMAGLLPGRMGSVTPYAGWRMGFPPSGTRPRYGVIQSPQILLAVRGQRQPILRRRLNRLPAIQERKKLPIPPHIQQVAVERTARLARLRPHPDRRADPPRRRPARRELRDRPVVGRRPPHRLLHVHAPAASLPVRYVHGRPRGGTGSRNSSLSGRIVHTRVLSSPTRDHAARCAAETPSPRP